MSEREDVESILGPGLMKLLNGPVPDLRERERSYPGPMKRVCNCCGNAHDGPFQACMSCKAALDRGE